MSFRNATPVIRVSDYQRAKAFYTDVLGFDIVEETGEPVVGFGIFSAGSVQIFLCSWDGAGEPWDAWRAYFYVDDQPSFVARLAEKGVAFKGPKDTVYSMREVEVADPDGNVLCFGTDLTKAEPRSA
ncbi:MAG: glyoxalase superfamily protein [Pseudomonadota bacterium]